MIEKIPFSDKYHKRKRTFQKGNSKFINLQNIWIKKQKKQNIPFAQFPAALDAPFARFAPAALISFRHPGGGGTHFWQRLRGGGTKILRRLRGGVCVFYGHFSRKGPSSPLREILNSPLAPSNIFKCALIWDYSLAILIMPLFMDFAPTLLQKTCLRSILTVSQFAGSLG